MRVTHIITGLGDGGAEGVLARLCEASPHHRHEVVSLTDEGKYGPRLRASGVTVHTLDQHRGTMSARALLRLRRLLRASRPDVVQTWMYHGDLVGGLVARWAGSSNVFWNVRNTDLAPGKTPRTTIIVMRACALVSRWVPKRIACCAERAAELHQRLGYDPRKFVIIPNGIDGERFEPDPEAGGHWRSRNGIAADVPVIGMVARYDPQKDHANLIEALRLVRADGHPFTCVLAGTGMTEENVTLTTTISDAGLTDSVRLLGAVGDVPALMNALDLHVLSSAYGEAFPNAVAEAMACGTPCVVTDVGDAGRIVDDTGWTVPPADPPALARAIGEALASRERASWAQRCAAASRRIRETYSMERMVANYEAMWAPPGIGRRN